MKKRAYILWLAALLALMLLGVALFAAGVNAAKDRYRAPKGGEIVCVPASDGVYSVNKPAPARLREALAARRPL